MRAEPEPAPEPIKASYILVILGGGSGHRAASLASACLLESKTEIGADIGLGIGAGREICVRKVSWRDFLADPQSLANALEGADWLRFETPDQDVGELAALYRAGANEAERCGLAIVPSECEELIASGAICSPAQLSFGLQVAVKAACQLADKYAVRCSTTPDDLALGFDKTRSHNVFAAANIPVPNMLEPVTDFASLCGAMERARMQRVFVKLRHGAAAAGMVALACNGDHWRAVTTAEISADGVLRATRRVRTLHSRQEIAQVINRLAPLGLHVESWIPKIGMGKIGMGKHVADLRIVMQDGDVAAAIMRTSKHPITNLHLGGARLPASRMIEAIGTEHWNAVCRTACKVAAQFPDTMSLGVDIAITVGGRKHYVLEANIFGDFVKDEGSDISRLHRLAIRQMIACKEMGKETGKESGNKVLQTV